MALIKKNTPSIGKERSNAMNISNEKVFEAVRKRAYELYLKRGATHGSDQADWLEAERQVKRELNLSR